ncbi:MULTISPECIES: baseplate J/gp47 family protein [Sphingobium]|uniref:baseplate assembly protein n=1 Tax=Sphingobium TaxID=165695 RepID=UPI0015EC9347|nr:MULTISPECIES: baseplate J/gp47 family protein [Sphingobium]MCW2362449.1 phage-related baseplate assembly protein [Sphingobium sp. B10D3B]MCW2400871.1 phage-related baseplate assembly protein [Sphingobium sp. B10D7B]MCW2407850.1 phage-related baseplate assembly protein [Sphingobium xanthum]
MTDATFSAIDLSRLPAPAVVEQLSYEAIFGAMTASLLAVMPDFDASLESDPAVKILQIAAYRELLIRQHVNDAARAVMVAYAKGSDLDHLGALFGVPRLELVPADSEADTPAVMEDDEDFRRRIILAPEAMSVAGPSGAYIAHALSADGDVLDASAASPAPAEVTVYVLSRVGDGTAAPELLAAVTAALSDETVRPVADRVTVQSASIVQYAVQATIKTYAGPDPVVVLAEAQARVEAYVQSHKRLGFDVTRSGLFAALHVAGVQNVVLVEPAADIVIDPSEAAHCTGIALTNGGTDE